MNKISDVPLTTRSDCDCVHCVAIKLEAKVKRDFLQAEEMY